MDDAVISPCGTWRYRLDRFISMTGGPVIGFCLHNPSIADGRVDDPTSRRGVDFAGRWGARSLIYINPWAGRATKPADLWTMVDPVGPDNDRHIAEVAALVAESGGFIVAAWGTIRPPVALRDTALARLKHVDALIRRTGCTVAALGVNQDHSPKHPLYVRGSALPMQWPESWRTP